MESRPCTGVGMRTYPMRSQGQSSPASRHGRGIAASHPGAPIPPRRSTQPHPQRSHGPAMRWRDETTNNSSAKALQSISPHICLKHPNSEEIPSLLHQEVAQTHILTSHPEPRNFPKISSIVYLPGTPKCTLNLDLSL